MTHKFSEDVKTDVGFVPGAVVDGATGASAWYDLQGYGRLVGTLTCSSMETSEDIRLQIQQARSSTGLGATQVKSTNLSGYTGTTAVRQGVRSVESLTFTFSTAADGDLSQSWKINGLTFTLSSLTGANVPASRYVFNGLTGGAGAATRTLQTALHFTCAINNATYGISGITAAQTSATVTLTIDNPDGRLLDVSTWTSTGAGYEVASLMGIGGQSFVDVRRDQLRINDGYRFAKVSYKSSAATAMGIVVQRSEASVRPPSAELTT